jgi:hypothetical protein
MPYFPTEQDWTQMARPIRLDMVEHFPGKYAVNSLPLYGSRQVEPGLKDPRGKGKALQPRGAPKWGHKPTERAECLYPNTIPLGRESRQYANKTEEGEIGGPLDFPEEMAEIEEILTKIHADDSKFFLGTNNHS